MNESEFTVFEKSTKAMVRRISAENTWLRHTLQEIDARVQALHDQMTALEKRARAVERVLPAPAKPKPKTKSKTHKPVAKPTANSRRKK